MKHIIPAMAFALLAATAATAQTQHGYVKTKGRLASNGTVVAGTRLSGTALQVKGRTTVVSQSNGTFSFPIPAQNYYLQQVHKQGYVLTDPDVLSRQYTYSKNPLVLVLESEEQQANDQLDAKRKIRHTLTRQLQAKEEEIEQLKKQQKLSEDDYRKRLQEVYAQQESNEQLISEMAERYARIDFDEVDDFNRRISDCILNGRLTEADSLLKTKGDIHSRAATLRQHQEANARTEQELKKRQKKLEKSVALAQKEMEDLAQDCYNKFEIFKMQHQNDSALHYIVFRAELDTTNIKYQLETCSFLNNFMSSYEEALLYGYRAKSLSTEKVVDNSFSYVSSLLSIASVYYKKHDYIKSLEIYENAIELLERSDISIDLLCTAYNNVGVIYKTQINYSKALQFFQKSKDKDVDVYGEKHSSLIPTYNNIGDIFFLLKNNYDSALVYYEKALDIIRETNEKDSVKLAKTFINIGRVYEKKKNYDSALAYYQNALKIQTTIYGPFHPTVAICYESIGMLYNIVKEHIKSIDYMRKGLTIRHKIYGEIDPEIAMSYTMIATNYQELHYLDSAFIYHKKALDIQKSIYGEKHPYTAFNNLNLASYYKEKGNFEIALKYAEKALSVFKETLGNNHPYVATTLKFVGDTKKEQGLYSDALILYKEAEIIFIKVLGENNPKTKKVKQCIEEISN